MSALAAVVAAVSGLTEVGFAALRATENRAKKERFNGMIAGALFLLGAVVIVMLELLND